MRDGLLALMGVRRGHFALESGHHGDLWLDLDSLFVRPGALRPFVRDLARRLERYQLAGVCGPLTGGAFVAQLVALELDVEFWFTERVAPPRAGELFSAAYALPGGQSVTGRRVAVVNDVVNAGSAARATLAALQERGATPVALAALMVLGRGAAAVAAEQGVGLEYTETADTTLWTLAECPLCAAGVPLEDVPA